MDRPRLNRLVEEVGSAIAADGYECLDIETEGLVLRVYVDKTGGIQFSDCAKVTQSLQNLAVLGDLPENYTLEVSSPGVERPLRKQEHFRKNLGEMVRVRLFKKHQERKKGVGRVAEVTDDGMVSLMLEEEPWQFPLSAIDNARLVYDWGSQKDFI